MDEICQWNCSLEEFQGKGWRPWLSLRFSQSFKPIFCSLLWPATSGSKVEGGTWAGSNLPQFHPSLPASACLQTCCFTASLFFLALAAFQLASLHGASWLLDPCLLSFLVRLPLCLFDCLLPAIGCCCCWHHRPILPLCTFSNLHCPCFRWYLSSFLIFSDEYRDICFFSPRLLFRLLFKMLLLWITSMIFLFSFLCHFVLRLPSRHRKCWHKVFIFLSTHFHFLNQLLLIALSLHQACPHTNRGGSLNALNQLEKFSFGDYPDAFLVFIWNTVLWLQKIIFCHLKRCSSGMQLDIMSPTDGGGWQMLQLWISFYNHLKKSP